MDAFRLYYDEHIRHMLDNSEPGSKKVPLLRFSISNFVDKSYKMKKYKEMTGKS